MQNEPASELVERVAGILMGRVNAPEAAIRDAALAVLEALRPAEVVPASGVREALKAMKPFAEISPSVQTTHLRDGERVHSQRMPDGKYMTLKRVDFRRIAAAHAALSSALASPAPAATGGVEP